MKVRFYPRDIGMWRKVFDFDSAEQYVYADFENLAEAIDFLKLHGVKLDDREFPLEFRPDAHMQDSIRITHAVIQWSLIGWISGDALVFKVT